MKQIKIKIGDWLQVEKPAKCVGSGLTPFGGMRKARPRQVLQLGACPLNEQRATNSGFTLIEVLVTTGITALVLGLTFMCLYLTVFSSKDLINKNKRYTDLMRAYFRLRTQIIALTPVDGAEYLLKTIPGNEDKGGILYFITGSPADLKGVTEVQYEIKKDKDGAKYLAYRELPYAGYKINSIGAENDKSWITLSRKITGMKIDCSKDNLWFTKWESGSPPDKIRIMLYYKDEDAEKKFSFIAVPGIVEFNEIMNKQRTKDKE